jgi:hypothetical protein
MIEVEITQEMLDEAKLKSEDLGVLNRSYLKGDGNITGFLGERIAKDLLNASYANVDRINYDYDLIMPRTGITVDVKTKKTKVSPRPHYECGIMDYNSNRQHCDYYAFVRVKDDYTIGWFLGVKEKYKYVLESTFVPKGTLDKRNNFEQMTDSYNLEISKLDDEIKPDKIKASYFSHMLDRKVKVIDSEREQLLRHVYEKELLNNMKKWVESDYNTL